MITSKLLKQEFSVTDGIYKILCDVENGFLTITTMQGKHFYLITHPIIKTWKQRLDVILLTEKQGKELQKVFKRMKLIREAL